MKKIPLKLNDFAELKQVKKALQEQAQQIEKEKQQQRENLIRQQKEKNLFRHTMGSNITPLKTEDRATHAHVKPKPIPIQRQQDEKNVLQESISDEFDVESLLDTDEMLSYRRSGIGIDVVHKLRRGHWALQAQLDLHGYRRDEARQVLVAFLREATQQGLRCVRIVHGKGNGSPGKTPVLKSRVLSWLAQKSEVLAYVQARAADGGNGALIVLLNTA